MKQAMEDGLVYNKNEIFLFIIVKLIFKFTY